MSRRHHLILPLLSLAALLPPGEIVAADTELDQLHAVLQSEASVHEKAIACERLAVLGTRESVPLLAELLPDQRLSHYARFALETIPDASVDRVLRESLARLQGSQLVGVINSLGQRRDAEAVGLLSEKLSSGEPAVASAAAAALGRIANEAAAEFLRQQIRSAPDRLQPAVGDACLACAESLLEQQRGEAAAELYRAVRLSSLPKRFRVAATYAALQTGAPADLLREQLQAEDKAFFAIGVQAARELPADVAAPVLLEQVARQDPQRRAALLGALRELGDERALAAFRTACQDESTAVQVAAIRGIQQLGDASDLPLLLALATVSEESVSEAAEGALEALRGAEVDQAILSRLGDDSPQRALLIRLAGARRLAGAVPALLAAADAKNDSLRVAALRALGETIGSDDLDKLVARLTAARSPEEREAAMAALTSACMRAADRGDCVDKVAARFSQAPAETRAALFELFREVGGAAALRHVAEAARQGDDAVQDAATRVLGEWLTIDVAPELLELAGSLESQKYRIRALRGYIRVLRQFGLPLEERLAMARRAIEAAERDDEKKLVLQALPRFAAPESLALAVEHLGEPGLMAAAAQAAVAIADQIAASHPEAARAALEQVRDAGVGKALTDRAAEVLRKLDS